MPDRDVDLILLGGGLANGLIAWRLAEARPDISFVILEQADRLGGNHTWSFHDDDLTAPQRASIGELIAHTWPSYDVAFPGFRRRLGSSYSSITSQLFHERLTHRLGARIRLGAHASEATPTHVHLPGGETIRAGAVIDGRGVRASRHLALGYQKFLGQEIVLAQPHGLHAPIIMDATVPQDEGYRFVYVLPLAADRLIVEDTYYADGPTLDTAHLRARIAEYCEKQGWRGGTVLREESGVLPIVLSGDISAFWDEAAGMPRSGLAAALFHPTTGYSLPDAVRLADLIAGLPDLSAPALHAAIRAHAERQWRARRFFRLLNRMLFLAGAPDRRYAVMRRFYGLPEPLIRRFYAGDTTTADKLRILSGKPPVPVVPAARAAASWNLHRKTA